MKYGLLGCVAHERLSDDDTIRVGIYCFWSMPALAAPDTELHDYSIVRVLDGKSGVDDDQGT